MSELSDVSELHETVAEKLDWVSLWIPLGEAETTDPLGEYKVEVKVVDKLTGDIATESTTFILAAEASITQQEKKVAATELSNIQMAVIAMMVDNGLSTLHNPVTVATNDMGAFPDTSVCGVDKIQDPNGNVYIRGQDKNGYILRGHDITGDGDSTSLVHYLTVGYTKGTYTVDSTGTVTQVTTGYE